MSTKYKATTTEYCYFIKITTVGWIDIFTKLNQKQNIISSLQYCQEHKGLEIYAYFIMSSHIHLLYKTTNAFILWKYILILYLTCSENLVGREFLTGFQNLLGL